MNYSVKGYRMAAVLASMLASGWMANARTVTDLSGEGWRFDGAEVTVPHTWNATDAADGIGEEGAHGNSVAARSYQRGSHVYRRELAAAKPGKRYFVRFGGVGARASVWVNGVKIGAHTGAFTAFTLEATAAMTNGVNLLEVVADNSFLKDAPPISGDFSIFGGIYRGVELIETETGAIDPAWYGTDAIRIKPDPKTGRVTAKVKPLGSEKWIERQYDFGQVELWSPEHPKLYEVTVELGGDKVTRKVGFRTAEMRKDGFYLNGKKRFLKGTNRHQDRDGKGWAISAADEREDIEWIKRMGADAVRTAHYPQSRHFYDLCDERGLLVWIEIPLVEEIAFTPEFKANTIAMAQEMVAQNAEHPSIFIWGVFNELFGAAAGAMPKDQTIALVERVESAVKAMDASRPVGSVTFIPELTEVNAITDVLGLNTYPGWYFGAAGGADAASELDKLFKLNPSRTGVIVTEYGAGASVNQHNNHTWQPISYETEYPEEYQAWMLSNVYRALSADKRVWGAFSWVMFDFAADWRREADRYGINNKGLVTYDRKTPKDAFYFYKANWSVEPELHLVGARMKAIRYATADVLAFSNLGEVELFVNGKRFGVSKTDDVKTVRFEKVPLRLGDNEIEIRSGGEVRRANWKRLPSFSAIRLPTPPRTMPMWDSISQVIRKNRGVFDEIWFSAGTIVPLEEHRKIAKWMEKAVEEMRAAGFTASIEFELTIGNTDPCEGEKEAFRDWQGFTGPEGKVGVKCNCPRDPAFHRYMREAIRGYMVFKPDVVWIDDDCRIMWHGANSWGCFCDRCLGEFSRSEGRKWTREELVEAMKTDAELKSRFVDHCNLGLGVFAEQFCRAVKEFSPTSRLGLQYPFADEGQLRIIEGMLRGNGGEKIEIRPGSGAYFDDFFLTVNKTFRMANQMKTLKRLDCYSRWCPEIETYPRSFGCRTAKGLGFEPLLHMSHGIDTLTWYVLDGGEELEWIDSAILAALRRNIGLYRAYAATIADTEPIGFTTVATRLPRFDEWGAGWDPFPIKSEVVTTGLPFTFVPARSLGKMICGWEQVANTPRAELEAALKDKVICDQSAAWELAKAGLIDYSVAELEGHSLSDSTERDSAVKTLKGGGRIAVLNKFSAIGCNAEQIVAFSKLADQLTGGGLPVVWEEPAMCVTIPRVRKDGSLATVVFINTRADVQRPTKVRLRNFRSEKAHFHQLDGDTVELKVERDAKSGDALLTLPELGHWSGGFLSE